MLVVIVVWLVTYGLRLTDCLVPDHPFSMETVTGRDQGTGHVV